MPEKYLHLIAFNVPYPADYGGVIDIYYKLRSLQQVGILTILHCYTYGRQSSKELEDLCAEVHYYERDSGFFFALKRDPYIVCTRDAKTMPELILGDRFPVLFEGLHSTARLKEYSAAGKKCLVRAHNIEHEYYRALSRSENRLYDKFFLFTESKKLRRYEKILGMADHILGISMPETAYFQERYGHSTLVPAFHRFDEISITEGMGDYILFHGNLSVAENSDVFLRIAGNVLSKISHRVVVAGKNPSRSFIRKLEAWPHIELIANPGDKELDLLISGAQVNLLYTAQSTGIKLKLLHALFGGRHCLVNTEMIEGTGLEPLCRLADEPQDMIGQLDELMNLPFTLQQIRERENALQDYSNRAGAERILRLLD
ncbi:MAG: glycosyltransferase [Bacteroidetes bacterium]|nr:glycosyltransferase [Bacteroidota bacterium]